MDAPPQVLTLTISKVTSFVVFTQRRSVSMTGSYAQLRDFAKRTRTHNLLFGWWGFPFGLVWTPMVLRRNGKALGQLDELAASGTVSAGWYLDPTVPGRTRYWDGTAWTDRIREETRDPA